MNCESGSSDGNRKVKIQSLTQLRRGREAPMYLSLENLSGSDVSFLPSVAAFIKRLGIAEEVNRLCGGQSNVSPGHSVEAIALDWLNGHSLLYRLEKSFAKMDLELLLGADIPASKSKDDSVGKHYTRFMLFGNPD